jgi:hypothetical protein
MRRPFTRTLAERPRFFFYVQRPATEAGAKTVPYEAEISAANFHAVAEFCGLRFEARSAPKAVTTPISTNLDHEDIGASKQRSSYLQGAVPRLSLIEAFADITS